MKLQNPFSRVFKSALQGAKALGNVASLPVRIQHKQQQLMEVSMKLQKLGGWSTSPEVKQQRTALMQQQSTLSKELEAMRTENQRLQRALDPLQSFKK